MTNWLTLEEAARYLKMGKSTLYDLARKGKGVSLPTGWAASGGSTPPNLTSG